MKILITSFTTLLLIMSCGNSANESAETDLKSDIQKETLNGFEKKQDSNADKDSEQQTPQKEKAGPNQKISPPAIPDWDKKIIKTASLNIEIKDYESYNSSLREKVKQVGGYVAQEEQTQSDYKVENNLTIKVPVDQFDNAITLMTASVEKLNEKKITSQDVTTEVVDTKSRLEAKKQFRQRYLDLLKQAKNMEEILSVQSEINGIQEEIESAEGRIEYLSHASSFSTINLTFYQVLNAFAKNTDRPSFGTKLSQAFKTGWSWIGELFVGIVSIWPLLLIVFIAIIIYKRSRVSKVNEAA